MGSCSVPQIFGLKAWADKRFGDLCDWHDERYVKRDCFKMQADLAVSVMIAKRHPHYWPIGIVLFVLLTFNPLAYYMWYTE